MPKWVYPLAFAFVLFLIYNDPSGSGDTAGNFAGFIVELLGAVGQFLTGLFEGTNEGAGAVITSTSTTVADSVSSLSPDGVDSSLTTTKERQPLTFTPQAPSPVVE